MYKRINLSTLILSDIDINVHFLAEGGEVVCSNFFQKHGIGQVLRTVKLSNVPTNLHFLGHGGYFFVA